MTKEVMNRIALMFPTLTNQVTDAPANDNSLSTDALWSKLSEKFVLAAEKTLAPLSGTHISVQADLQTPNPDALPVVSVENADAGTAIKDCTDWDDSDLTSTYTQVTLHRFSRPFQLSSYDLQRGERVESKIQAAVISVLEGVVKEYMDTIAGAADLEYISSFGPSACAALSGVFPTDTANLFLTPAQHAAIVPTDKIGLDLTEGAYGIGHIYKSAVMPSDTDIVATTKDAIVGAIATPAVLSNHAGSGMDIRQIGTIAGCPLLLKSKLSWNESLKCSVEVLAGFACVKSTGIKRLAVGEAPVPSNFGPGPDGSEYENGPENHD